MTINELLNDKVIDLPIIDLNKSSKFVNFLTKIYNNYCMKVKRLEKFEYSFDGYGKLNNIDFISASKNFTNAIIKAVQIYLKGDPHGAYEELTNVLHLKGIQVLLNKVTIDENQDFYRVRVKENNLNHIEMFHIPFNKRGKVTTKRYSIPGFPSLYLSNSLYLCWEELGRPNIELIHASRFNNLKKLVFIDFSLPNGYRKNYKNTKDINKNTLKYLMTWPLISACSIKVKFPEDNFKPEYIIPQLSLLWVRKNNDKIDGIKYFSTHVENTKEKSEGEFINFVVPVKENKEKGHCSQLSNLFKFTEPLSHKGLYQLNGVSVIDSEEALNKANKKVKKLSLINGLKSPYSSSVFANWEAILDEEYMKAKKLKSI